jgi:hypothetical protein
MPEPLTAEKALRLTIDLWEWIAKTGKLKESWPRWQTYKDVMNKCFLCEYDSLEGQRQIGEAYIEEGDCRFCPLFLTFKKMCTALGYDKYRQAQTREIRQWAAGLFLQNLKKVKL